MKKYTFYFGAGVAFILPFIPGISSFASGIALILGLLIAVANYTPATINVSKYRKLFLNGAIILFGFGLNINQVISVGASGIWKSALSLIITITVGLLLMKYINIDRKTGMLIDVGTAICGGSAIAAVSPVINADDQQIGISTGVIFALNTVALFLFALFAHLIPLSAEQFGTWAALSIHDTSSVVGAAAMHSDAALQVATILKLTRTLWIIPIVLILAFVEKSNKKGSFPLFIIFFILASLISSFFPNPDLYITLTLIGKAMLSLALFLVGTTLHPKTITNAGLKPILFGVILWVAAIISGFCIAIL
ncbi:YeiH family protein [Culicoidibacter larvae]|nr:putative sulfate exporter family transporter [Culicoidibacter larvae]